MMVYVGWLKLRTTLSSEGAPMWWQTHSDGGRMRWYMWAGSNHILPLALMALPCDGRRVLAQITFYPLLRWRPHAMVYVGWLKPLPTFISDGAHMRWQTRVPAHADSGVKPTAVLGWLIITFNSQL